MAMAKKQIEYITQRVKRKLLLATRASRDKELYTSEMVNLNSDKLTFCFTS